MVRRLLSPCVSPERLKEASLASPPLLETVELRHLLKCETCLDAWVDLKDALSHQETPEAGSSVLEEED